MIELEQKSMQQSLFNMKRITQKDRVKQHLISVGKITSWEAIKHFGATRLSDIIYRLRDEGMIIESKRVSSINRFGDSVHFVDYIYKG